MSLSVMTSSLQINGICLMHKVNEFIIYPAQASMFFYSLIFYGKVFYTPLETLQFYSIQDILFQYYW